MRYRLVIMAVLMAWAGFGHAAGGSERRVALIIANTGYSSVPALRNPQADGRLMAKALSRAGFGSVELLENLDKAGMERALRSFGSKADGADVAFIYYAGHGIEFGGRNYLIPIDAALIRDRGIETEAVPLDSVVSISEGARRLRVIVLDACRNNPFAAKMTRSAATRSIGRGLAAIEPSGESLIVYSAKAGATATDGSGANSPFATTLASRIVEPGRKISLLFRQVRDDVLNATGREQEPFTYVSLSGSEFYFVDGQRGSVGKAAPVRQATINLEDETWQMCRSALTGIPCTSYVQRYPKGRFTSLASDRLRELAASVVKPRDMPTIASAPAELVPALGVVVGRGADNLLYIASVQANALAEGQLFPGDKITQIDSEPINSGISPRQALERGFNHDRRVKLLVKRGPTTTIVILRAGTAL